MNLNDFVRYAKDFEELATSKLKFLDEALADMRAVMPALTFNGLGEMGPLKGKNDE